jgi:hypothetical protein
VQGYPYKKQPLVKVNPKPTATEEERYPAGGHYDEQGFYVYVNGSFVDPNGYFFD